MRKTLRRYLVEVGNIRLADFARVVSFAALVWVLFSALCLISPWAFARLSESIGLAPSLERAIGWLLWILIIGGLIWNYKAAFGWLQLFGKSVFRDKTTLGLFLGIASPIVLALWLFPRWAVWFSITWSLFVGLLVQLPMLAVEGEKRAMLRYRLRNLLVRPTGASPSFLDEEFLLTLHWQGLSANLEPGTLGIGNYWRVEICGDDGQVFYSWQGSGSQFEVLAHAWIRAIRRKKRGIGDVKPRKALPEVGPINTPR